MGGKVEAPYFQFAPLAQSEKETGAFRIYKALSAPTRTYSYSLGKYTVGTPPQRRSLRMKTCSEPHRDQNFFADNAILCVYSTVERAGETRAYIACMLGRGRRGVLFSSHTLNFQLFSLDSPSHFSGLSGEGRERRRRRKPTAVLQQGWAWPPPVFGLGLGAITMLDPISTSSSILRRESFNSGKRFLCLAHRRKEESFWPPPPPPLSAVCSVPPSF